MQKVAEFENMVEAGNFHDLLRALVDLVFSSRAEE